MPHKNIYSIIHSTLLETEKLNIISIPEYKTLSGHTLNDVKLSYRLFGKHPLDNNSVMICHALTGNSMVCGENGWWNGLVGAGKTIDTNKKSVIVFDIPGNGSIPFNYDPKIIQLKDVAKLILLALEQLSISTLYAGMGGSLGGGLIWELAVEKPDLFSYIFPIGSHYQSVDWVIGSNYVQEKILETSSKPVEVARMLAMLFYRSSYDFQEKFNRSVNHEGKRNIEAYLTYQGEKLNNRFSKESYLAMNHMLSSIDVSMGYASLEEALKKIQSKVKMIGINTDILFPTHFNIEALQVLKSMGKDVEYLEIDSIHGHDAFLIEFDKLDDLIGKYFR